MSYRLSRKAEEDILQIYLAGVGEFGVRQAERYHEGLERAFIFLSNFPRAAPERLELNPPSRVHLEGRRHRLGAKAPDPGIRRADAPDDHRQGT